MLKTDDLKLRNNGLRRPGLRRLPEFRSMRQGEGSMAVRKSAAVEAICGILKNASAYFRVFQPNRPPAKNKSPVKALADASPVRPAALRAHPSARGGKRGGAPACSRLWTSLPKARWLKTASLFEPSSALSRSQTGAPGQQAASGAGVSAFPNLFPPDFLLSCSLV